MPTEIYGMSDDLIEFDGDVPGEVGCYGTDDEDGQGVLIMCSDGTVLAVKYSMNVGGVWGIALHAKGSLFDRLEVCNDEDAERYSDVAHFKDGLKWAYAATKWEKVQ